MSLQERQPLDRVVALAKDCRNCDLWKRSTQTVFGESAPGARVLFVGEQPGDKEDLTGRPFVAPAGALLDKAVKHFKWEQRHEEMRLFIADLKRVSEWMEGRRAA